MYGGKKFESINECVIFLIVGSGHGDTVDDEILAYYCTRLYAALDVKASKPIYIY